MRIDILLQAILVAFLDVVAAIIAAFIVVGVFYLGYVFHWVVLATVLVICYGLAIRNTYKEFLKQDWEDKHVIKPER